MQGGPELPHRAVAIAGRRGQRGEEDLLHRVGDLEPEGARRGAARGIAAGDRELHEVVPLERGRAAAEDLHEDQRHREDVGPRAGGAVHAAELLGAP